MKIPALRWWIVAVLVGAAVLNYLDRAALAIASKHIIQEFSLTHAQYGWVNSVFMIAYTLSYVLGGILVDRLGTRRSVIATLAWWSLANMGHALARGFRSLMALRFGLGLGEAAFYTAGIRACAEWFQPRDQSKPIGLILAGASAGALFAPTLVAWMMARPAFGWRGAFAVTGAAGFLLLPAWLFFYRRPESHPYLTDEERDYLADSTNPSSGGSSKTVREEPWPLRSILRTPQAWILIAARGLTDASWFLIIFWLTLYFQDARHFTDDQVKWFIWIPFAAADLGALFGGWFASRLIQRGADLLTVRRACMLGFPLLLPATLIGFYVPQSAPYLALALFSVATFGHMAWGTNQLTLHSDLFPRTCVATIMGLSGGAGALASIVVQPLGGWLVDQTHSYLPIFLTTAILHPVAGVMVFFSLRGLGPPELRR